MNNPLRILQTLDQHLTASAELTIFSRAALVLGYPDAPTAFAATRDVDAILPIRWLTAPDENLDFWQAQQKTNAELEPSGLYITHLFRELEIILSPEWLANRVQLSLSLARLKVVGQLRNAFGHARLPDVPEIRALFAAAQPKVLQIVSSVS